MTPQQALQILDNAAGQAHLTRNDHIAVQEALAIVRAAITPPTADDKATPPAPAAD